MNGFNDMTLMASIRQTKDMVKNRNGMYTCVWKLTRTPQNALKAECKFSQWSGAVARRAVECCLAPL